jgi:Thiamine pyrophosphate-requiring enzymes [acetolactate synthase, pyruvate dehydrogenase (cytochrome), glyoxylate carboligase, phosphonopyruvate decarboxylase]
VVANNQQWLAVRQSTLDVFPDGHAAKANVMALTELKPSPDYEKVVETCGGRGEKVEGPSNSFRRWSARSRPCARARR